MKSFPLLLIVAVVAFASCDRIKPSHSGNDTSETTSVERGVAAVGRRLETAAADLKSKLVETRVQAIVDNMRGFDGIEATLTAPREITLKGTVADDMTRKEALRIVGRIEGIDHVRDSMRVGVVDTTSR